MPFLDRLLELDHAAVRGAGRLRLARRHHPAATSRSAPRTSRGSCPTLNTYGRGPAHALRFGFDRAAGAGRRRHHGRRQRRPARRSSRWSAWSSGASWSPPRRATCTAASRSAARSSKGMMSRLAGLSLYWFARVGTHDATNSFKAYDRRLRPRGRHRVRRRLRDRHRAGGQGPAPPAARWPSSRPSGSTGGPASPTSSSGPGSRKYLRWYRYAFGQEAAVSTVLVSGSSGFIGGYVVAGAAGRGPRGHRHRQPLEVRAGRALLRRRPRLPAGRGRRPRRRR